METTKNNSLIISILALRHKAIQRATDFSNLSKFDIDVLIFCSAFSKGNTAFEIGELADFSGHDSSNLHKSSKKLEREGLIQCIVRPKERQRPYAYMLTGKGNAVLRKFCNLYQSGIS